MSKPIISIPASFADNGIKTDFPSSKINNGFDNVSPDILAGDNLNKFIDDTYKGLNGVLELYDTKVNKTGDTMTGPLDNMNTSVTKGTNPSSNKYWEWRNLDNNQNPAEWHTNRMSAFQTTLYPNGTVETQIKAFQNDLTVSTTADIKLAITSSGVKSCEFPDTKCCDGQWLTQSAQIASDVSLAVGTAQIIEYDISNYLPNDGYSYEVKLSIDAQTGSGSGAGLTITIRTKDYNGNNTWTRICDMVARGSWTLKMGNNAIVPVGTDRKIVVDYTVGSNAATLTGLRIDAYRRIGTNA